MLAPSWSHGSKFLSALASEDQVVLAPSWSHGSKFVYLKQYPVAGHGWLPRGAMDLNRDPTAEKPDRDGWLPRGAMDLN